MLIQGSGISGISVRVRHKVSGMGTVLDCGTEFPLHVDIWYLTLLEKAYYRDDVTSSEDVMAVC